MLLRSNFSSFPHYFIYIFLTSGVKLHIHLLNVVVQFIVFHTLSTLICRGIDISKYFSESFGIRDNESRLYIDIFAETELSSFSSFCSKNINVFENTLATTVHEFVINELLKLTML